MSGQGGRGRDRSRCVNDRGLARHESEPLALGETPGNDDPYCIRAAEEFLAIRYVSLIRAVLVNLRYLMYFISTTFALAIMAWNSYPFQPRQVIDWMFTLLLIILGSGVVWVFAQMYRDPILSRITHTTSFIWRDPTAYVARIPLPRCGRDRFQDPPTGNGRGEVSDAGRQQPPAHPNDKSRVLHPPRFLRRAGT